VGKLLLDRHLPAAPGPRQVTPDEERAWLGIDHAACSAMVADAWRLPAPVVDAVASHHHRQPTPGGAIVAVADALVRHWGVGIWTYARVDLEQPRHELTAAGADLGLTGAQVSAWCEELPPVLAGLEEMVRVVGKVAPPALPAGEERTADPAPASTSRRGRRRGERPGRRQERDRRRR
jgi:hypothetical protein